MFSFLYLFFSLFIPKLLENDISSLNQSLNSKTTWKVKTFTVNGNEFFNTEKVVATVPELLTANEINIEVSNVSTDCPLVNEYYGVSRIISETQYAHYLVRWLADGRVMLSVGLNKNFDSMLSKLKINVCYK